MTEFEGDQQLAHLAATQEVRQAFWDAAAEFAPEAMEQLLGETMMQILMQDEVVNGLAALVGPIDSPALVEWCTRYHINGMLEYDVRRGVTRAFRHYQATGRIYDGYRIICNWPVGVRFSAAPGARSTYKPLDIDLSYFMGADSLFHWDPVTERRADAEARLLEVVGERLRTAMDTREDDMNRMGVMTLDHLVQKRTMRHFEWLVRYQMLEQSTYSMSKLTGIQTGHLLKPIAETAKLVGLELREKGKPGRRKLS